MITILCYHHSTTSSWAGTFPYLRQHMLYIAFVVGGSPSHWGQSSSDEWLMPSVWSRMGKRNCHQNQSQDKSIVRRIFLHILHLCWKYILFLAENVSFADHTKYISTLNRFGWLHCRWHSDLILYIQPHIYLLFVWYCVLYYMEYRLMHISKTAGYRYKNIWFDIWWQKEIKKSKK